MGNCTRSQAYNLASFIVRLHLEYCWKEYKYNVQNKLPDEEDSWLDELLIDQVLDNFGVLNVLLKCLGNELGMVG
jgi:hypothetical protein